MKVDALSDLDQDVLRTYEKEAQSMADQCEFFVEKATDKQIAEDIKASEFGKGSRCKR